MPHTVRVSIDGAHQGKKGLELTPLHAQMIAEKRANRRRFDKHHAIDCINECLAAGNEVMAVTKGGAKCTSECDDEVVEVAASKLLRTVRDCARKKASTAVTSNTESPKGKDTSSTAVSPPSTGCMMSPLHSIMEGQQFSVQISPQRMTRPWQEVTSPVHGLCKNPNCNKERRSDDPHTTTGQRHNMAAKTWQLHKEKFLGLCPVCFAQGTCAMKDRLADEAVNCSVANMLMKPSLSWQHNGDLKVIVMSRDSPCLCGMFRKVFGSSISFQALAHQKHHVRHVHLEAAADEDHLLDSLGGTLNHPIPTHRNIMAPLDGTFACITLPVTNEQKRKREGKSPNNHMLLHNEVFLAEAVFGVMEEESPFIESNIQLKRRGAATGRGLPTDDTNNDPKDLSVGTRTGRSHSIQLDSKTTGYWVQCWSQRGRKMIRRLVCNDMKGRVLRPASSGKESLFKWASGSVAFRTVMLKKLEARIKHFTVLECFHHEPLGLFEDMRDWLKEWKRISKDHQHFAPEVTDPWERFLLLCHLLHMTAHINHQACKAHTDSNGNETMVLFPRWDGSRRRAAEVLLQAKHGELALLNVAAGVGMLPQRTIVHATLDETTHAADESRNFDNFSVVLHPRKNNWLSSTGGMLTWTT